MHQNKLIPKINLIAEIHPQFSGDIGRAQMIIQQCKLAGADAVKVQLYDSQALFGNSDREYLQFSKSEFRDVKAYCDHVGIELFASIFTADRIDWCEELGLQTYKIASRTIADIDLCKKILATGKKILISLGAWDWKTQGMPFEGDNLVYFYCVSKYPTIGAEVEMPSFSKEQFLGYSDHTPGIGASLFAVARGAQYIEKHFTPNRALQNPTELAHLGGMDFDELRQLRNIADEISMLRVNAIGGAK
ncbi:MAG: N-acetylneuraminate synthase family protein [Anaerolineales bacterium]|nr:MAG: N-acetylneuraminate synthase family protein [Anaerolineales bacterium]